MQQIVAAKISYCNLKVVRDLHVLGRCRDFCLLQHFMLHVEAAKQVIPGRNLKELLLHCQAVLGEQLIILRVYCNN